MTELEWFYWQVGRIAKRNGFSASDCPYSIPWQANYWMRGFYEACRETHS